jgi:hypothetical protein
VASDLVATLPGVAFPTTEVAAGASAAGAVAAWLAATTSREAVARSHRPFVWPEWTVEPAEESEEKRQAWLVRLHNDGPGVALDVRWSVEGAAQYPEQYETTAADLASEPIRGMRPGMSVPPIEDPPGHLLARWRRVLPFVGDIEWVVVRFTDSAGVRWEYAEPWEPGTLADPARRLRRVRIYKSRTWQWWLWRLRPRRPLRAWLSLREPADW